MVTVDSPVAHSLRVLRASAVAMIVTLMLFPAVTRLRQLGVPQNPAAFSGVHRSGVVPPDSQLAAPEDSGYRVLAEPVTHPATRVTVRRESTITAVGDNGGLRAPPAILS